MKYVIQIEDFDGIIVEKKVFDTEKERNEYMLYDVYPMLHIYSDLNYIIYIFSYNNKK